MDEEFPEIKTGNGIDRDLAATTNDRLKKTVIALKELDNTFSTESGQTRFAINELIATTVKENTETQKAVNSLTKTIRDLDSKNSRLQLFFLILTVIATLFTVAQIVQVIDIFARGIGK